MSERIVFERNFANYPRFLCSIGMGWCSVDLFSDRVEIAQSLISRTGEYISSFPGWDVRLEPSATTHEIVYIESDKSYVEWDSKFSVLTAYGKREDYEDGQAIAYIGFWLMEVQRQSKSTFTLHSSAFELQGKGVLLLGHSGSGKTSVLMGMCERFGGRVISNDLTILRHGAQNDTMVLENGTKEIRLRYSSIKSRFKHLLPLFLSDSGSGWTTKIPVSPKDLGFESFERECLLRKVFSIHLDKDEKSPLVVSRETDIAIRYLLYEDMSRIIRGSAISLFGKDNKFLGYLPSLDSQELHNKRVAAIQYIVDDLQVILVSGGNLKEICNMIYTISTSQ